MSLARRLSLLVTPPQVYESLAYERENAVGVFTSGRNLLGDELGLTLLSYYDAIRFDDGSVQEAEVSYTPPLADAVGHVNGNAQGTLEVRLGRSTSAALSVPLTLGQLRPDGRAATVGFTASTGLASERHDLLSFSLCQGVGCSTI